MTRIPEEAGLYLCQEDDYSEVSRGFPYFSHLNDGAGIWN
jgi:hypothetical protein